MYSLAVILSLASTLELVSSDTTSSRLFVHLPESLKVASGYEHREALFGIPPYGGSITQQVYWADSQLCSSDVDKTMGYPKTKDSESGELQEWNPPYILMVDRGGCTFVTKVRNAQRAGAAGVLIADDQCQCSDDECQRVVDSTVCEKKEPIMADDGSGSDVSIPSFLMAKHDADKVKNVLKENQFVQVEMKWSIPSNDDSVEYDLWSTPADPVSVDFFNKFKVFAKALQGKASFTPHAYIIDGFAVNCQSDEFNANNCNNLCTNKGRYCAVDPDHTLESGVKGKDVVVESLRRLCIWEIYGKEDGVGEGYWDYVSTFNEQCQGTKYFTDVACVRDAYRVGKIDENKVAECMDVNFDESVEIGKFDLELREQEQQGIVVVPTAFVNNAAIRGHLTANNMFHAICAGFAIGSEPEICQQCASCADSYTCVNSGVCETGNGSVTLRGDTGVSKSTFSSSIFFIICIFLALGVWHYKKTKDEMRDQVRGILAEYMPLEDNDGAGPNVMMQSPMDFARGGTTTSLMS